MSFLIYMPYRKHQPLRHNKKRKGQKAPYHKKKARYQKAVVSRMRGPGLADTLFVRLTYVDQLVLAPGVPVAQHTFRGNSCFDPDYTGGGHQPLYFDQYATLYSKYRVVGSAIRVDSVNTSSTCAAYFICWPHTDVAGASTISQELEQGRAKAPKILPIAQRGPEGRLKSYCSTRKACGLTKAQMADDDFSALTGNNPIQIWYWNLLWGTTDTTTACTVNAVVKLTYYVQFYEKRIVSPS